jgi:hypothetical protein
MLYAQRPVPEIQQRNARQRSLKMVKVALSIRLEAKSGKEKEVEQFLLAGLRWYAMNRRVGG